MKRARTGGRGSVFTPADFLDMAGRAAVDQALSRLAQGRQAAPLGARPLRHFPKRASEARPALARTRRCRAGACPGDELAGADRRRRRGPYPRPVHPGSRQGHLFDRRSFPPRRARQADRRSAARFTQALDRSRQRSWHRRSGAEASRLGAGDRRRAVAALRLSASDKKMLATSAVQAPAWMRATLGSIAMSGAVDGKVRRSRPVNE